MLIQTHSCEREFNPINIYSWNAGDWDSNGVVHVEGKFDLRVTDMFQIKLNYTAFNATDNSLFFQCGVRLRSFNHPIYTCHKIQLTSKLFVSHDLHLYLFSFVYLANISSCSQLQETSDFFFNLDFIDNSCQDYKVCNNATHVYFLFKIVTITMALQLK